MLRLDLGAGVVFRATRARQHHGAIGGGGDSGRVVRAPPRINAEAIGHSVREDATFVQSGENSHNVVVPDAYMV